MPPKSKLKSQAKSSAVATAAVSAPASSAPPSDHKRNPDSMVFAGHQELIAIIVRKAVNIGLINARHEVDDPWFSAIKRFALQSEILGLADAMREYMRRHSLYSNTLQQATWEKLRNIEKHFAQSVTDEAVFDLASKLGGVLLHTLTSLTKVRDTEHPALDEKQINVVASAVDLFSSQSNSLHTILDDFLATVDQTEPAVSDEAFYRTIVQKFIPVINRLASPFLQETNAGSQSLPHYGFIHIAALSELLKQCGILYTPERQRNFDRIIKSCDFCRNKNELQKFLNAAKTVCNKMGHENPKTVTNDEVIAACGLALSVSSDKCPKPSDIDLTYKNKSKAAVVKATKSAAARADSDDLGADRKSDARGVSAAAGDQKLKSPLVMAGGAAPPGGVPVTYDSTTADADLDEKVVLVDDAKAVIGKQKTTAEFLHDLAVITNDLSKLDPEQRLRARATVCVYQHADSLIIKNFLAILEGLKTDFSALEQLKNPSKKQRPNKSKLISDRLQSIDQHVATLIAMRAKLREVCFKLTCPDIFNVRDKIARFCLLGADGMFDYLCDADAMDDYLAKHREKAKHPYNTGLSINREDHIYAIATKSEVLMEDIRNAPIKYIDNLVACWQISRPDILKQFNIPAEQPIQAVVQPSPMATAAASASPMPPSAPVVRYAENAANGNDDDKHKYKILSDEKIDQLLNQASRFNNVRERCNKTIQFMQDFNEDGYTKISISIRSWCKNKNDILCNEDDYCPGFASVMRNLLTGLKKSWLKPDELAEVKRKIEIVKTEMDKLNTDIKKISVPPVAFAAAKKKSTPANNAAGSIKFSSEPVVDAVHETYSLPNFVRNILSYLRFYPVSHWLLATVVNQFELYFRHNHKNTDGLDDRDIGVLDKLRGIRIELEGIQKELVDIQKKEPTFIPSDAAKQKISEIITKLDTLWDLPVAADGKQADGKSVPNASVHNEGEEKRSKTKAHPVSPAQPFFRDGFAEISATAHAAAASLAASLSKALGSQPNPGKALRDAVGMDESQMPLEQFEKMVETNRDIIDEMNGRDMVTALYIAIEKDRYDKAQTLWSRGANLDIECGADPKGTPRALLKRKADEGNEGAKNLQVAIMMGEACAQALPRVMQKL